ncbi:MAG: hypothetical protein WEB58_05295 [Planctomycetaceae bacterium]
MSIIAHRQNGKADECRSGLGRPLAAVIIFVLLLVQFCAPASVRSWLTKPVQEAEPEPVSPQKSSSELPLEEWTAASSSRFRRLSRTREMQRFKRRLLFTSLLLDCESLTLHDPAMARRNGCGAILRC